MYDGKDVNNLPPGPYQLTPGVAYDDYAEEPGASLLSDVAAARLQRL